MKRDHFLLSALGVFLLSLVSACFAQDVKFPPVADLESQVDLFVKDLEKSLEDAADDFDGMLPAIQRDANSLILIALSLGITPDANKYKEAAPEIIAAAQLINDAKDLKTAQTIVADIKKSLTGKSADKLDWTKVAAMSPVMKLAVPKINTKLNTSARSDRYLKRGVENVTGGTAVLAAFAQGLLPNVDETEKKEAKEDWGKFLTQFRDAALKANQAAHDYADGKADFDTFKASYNEMKEDCDKCHEVFVAGGVKTEE
ncbi:MAG: hypothetical protein LBQ54_06225 [Planctomycetaceae bacterium]|jgi:3-keto-L-gulonate-6-phosphate decarboxylase|nr:hypothetical protein [Planctomycetaceae bacterium]